MTDQYAVIGNPIGHTKSPLIHGLFAEETRQDLSYTAIEGPLEPQGAFAETVRAFIANGGKGMNVTAPFKLQAFAMADERSERAELAGAVNAMKFEGGRIIAENFDGIGLVRDIEVNLGLPMAGKRVLMLGAGGAARGALLPFLAAGPAEMVLVNRDVEKGKALAAKVGATWSPSRLRLRRSRSDGTLRSGGQRDVGQSHRRPATGSAERLQPGRRSLRTRLRKAIDALPPPGAQCGRAHHRGRRGHAGGTGSGSLRLVARRAARDARP